MMTCNVLSPDIMGCTRLAGHHLAGVPSCKNASTGQEWCGYCIAWSCTLHGITGQQAKALMPYELDHLYQSVSSAGKES